MKDVVIVVIVVFTLSILSNAEAKVANGLSVDLIHRDSILSPFYNPSLSQTEVLRNAFLRSVSRSNSPHFTRYGSKAETLMIPNGGDYLMKIFVGTPPIEAYAIADTGSSLIWVQCLPCVNCFPQNPPIFDPNNSSTFELQTCSSDACKLLPSHSCGLAFQCRYDYSYGDSSRTEGDLAKDVINFGSNGSTSVVSQKSIMGCGHQNSGLFTPNSTGIVGLGRSPLSLVSQLGNEIGQVFSYCLFPSWSNETSKLTFGNQPTITGKGVVSTPFVIDNPSTFYYLTLEAIDIDGTNYTAIQNVGNIMNDNATQNVGNILIDSGTALTYLETRLYNAVEAAIAQTIEDYPMRDPPSPFKLCYRDQELFVIVEITFHFAGGAAIRFPIMNMFHVYDHDICLLMVPRAGNYSILGNMAQANFKVEYDVPRGMVSFAPADCSKE